ncbi:MAG: substrate-binding domain-containing protein [Bacteroidales bacterium]|nr:substrate-binding domain-containing protein [Bacteroidales bacterium]
MFKLMLLCDYSREPERRLLKGVSSFAATVGGWMYFRMDSSLYLNPARRHEVFERAREIKADAIFGNWAGADRETVESLGIPVVLRAGRDYAPGIPSLGGSYQEIGRMGAEFFLRRRYVNYAFFGYSDRVWSRERREGYSKSLAEADARAFSFETWENRDDVKDLKEWLSSLPKPVAIFAANDVLASRLVEYCHELKFAIPEDVALLGVDNDEFQCNLSYPGLSSVNLDYESQGYLLGQTIWEMHSQGKIWPARISIHPLNVVERGTTPRHNISDPYVRRIVEKMDSEFNSGISLEEITADIPLSRRSIELRFKKEMSPYTMLSYLNKIRADHMARLLKEGDIPVYLAAEKAGFEASASAAGRVFKNYYGVSPAQYRKKKEAPR